MGATSGAGTAYHFRISEFTPVVSGVPIARSWSSVKCFVDRCLFFFLLTIVLSILRLADSDYIFSIFKLFLLFWIPVSPPVLMG